MKRTALALTLIMELLFSAVAGMQSVNLAAANPQPVHLPTVIILSDGRIAPSTDLVAKTGNVYTLTDNITGYSVDIQCNNITFDGAGFTLSGGTVDFGLGMYNSNTGISIEANGVTIKNVNTYHYRGGMNITGSSNTITETDTDGVTVTGSFNTVTGNNMSGIFLAGDYNNVTENRIGGNVNVQGNHNTVMGNIISSIDLWGDYNTITRNVDITAIDVLGSHNNITSSFISKTLYIRESASFTTIVGNTLEDCSVSLNKDPNTFYLNNFMNCTFDVQFNPYEDSPIIYRVNVFDNGSAGNYWSNYNGKDANRDGVGDTPHAVPVVGHTPFNLTDVDITDRYPLMAPYDIENNTIVVPASTEPFPTALVVVSIVTVAVVGVGLLVYFKKRKHQS